jgi:hypothetical protein
MMPNIEHECCRVESAPKTTILDIGFVGGFRESSSNKCHQTQETASPASKVDFLVVKPRDFHAEYGYTTVLCRDTEK